MRFYSLQPDGGLQERTATNNENIKGPEIQDQHSAQESKHPCTPTALGDNSHAPRQSLSNKKIQEGSQEEVTFFYVPFPFGHFLGSQEQLSRSGSMTQSSHCMSPKQRCQQPLPYRRIKTSWGGEAAQLHSPSLACSRS